MPEINSFDVLKEMAAAGSPKVKLAPLSNVKRANIGRGEFGEVVMAVDAESIQGIAGGTLVGGLILADAKEFAATKARLAGKPPEGDANA